MCRHEFLSLSHLVILTVLGNGTVIIPILEVRKLRPREIRKKFMNDHTDDKLWRAKF